MNANTNERSIQYPLYSSHPVSSIGVSKARYLRLLQLPSMSPHSPASAVCGPVLQFTNCKHGCGGRRPHSRRPHWTSPEIRRNPRPQYKAALPHHRLHLCGPWMHSLHPEDPKLHPRGRTVAWTSVCQHLVRSCRWPVHAGSKHPIYPTGFTARSSCLN